MKIVLTILLFVTANLLCPVTNAQILCGYDMGRTDTTKAKLFKAAEEKLHQQIRHQILKTRQAQMEHGLVRNNAAVIKRNDVVPAVVPPVVYIPVVFHIISEDPFSVTDAMVQAAVDDLNKAYAHQDAYSVDTLGADTRIQFKLAQRAPDGGKSTGINRIKSYYETMDVDLEDAAVKGLINWDPSRYANIWVVKKINGEIQPSLFECGKWSRMAYGGYASAGGGLVVAGLGTTVLAHEMGHYLSLLHTFQGTNCLNNDCTTDGDQVCDTPPDRSMLGSSCTNPENSCSTDTLSGPFTEDKRDNISNFMDYGTSCPTVFTPGQGERMRAFLEVFNGGSLLVSNGATPPCAEDIRALYEVTANPYPETGSEVGFTNRSAGADHYEWYVKDYNTGIETQVGTTVNLQHVFTTTGTYAVTLRALNATATCYSSYYTQIIVNCGTVARFSPNKRIVASKAGIYEDTVTFKNSSHNADSFEWYIRNNTTGAQQMAGTTTDLKYSFPEKGNYSIWLKATKGGCVSNSGTFNMNVTEATSDAIVELYSVNCSDNENIRMYFGIRNLGIDTIPAGTTVRFYDKAPTHPDRKELSSLFKTTADIPGKCVATFVHVVKTARNRQDSVYLILDEENSIQEISKLNNLNYRFKFQPTRSITPNNVTVLVNSTQALQLNYAPDPLTSVVWSSNIGSINCTGCVNTSLKILDTTYLKVRTVTQYGCEDSATATIHVFPNDLKAGNPEIYCYKSNDSILVNTKLCLLNGYEQLKRSIKVQYYDRIKTAPGAVLLYETILDISKPFTAGCTDITHRFARKGATTVYGYFNPDLALYEEQTANNMVNIPYLIYSIGVPETAVSVYRGEPYPLSIYQYGEPVTSIAWTPAFALNCTDCFTPFLKTNSSTLIKTVATSKYGCADSAQIAVNAYYRSHLALPNVFTPNGDGNNDYFYVIAGKEVTQVKLFRILNRWGATVFNSSNTLPNSYTDGWNGTQNGKPAEEGTYIYQIIVQLSNGTTETYKGNITLIR